MQNKKVRAIKIWLTNEKNARQTMKLYIIISIEGEIQVFLCFYKLQCIEYT